ncbi:MAG: PAS domain S-box protein, partial [Thermoplasmata archaeon]|nr:PAS domain S-box protein [Thermoplasmata archaeon]
ILRGIVIVALGFLFALFAVLIGLQAANLSLISWILTIAIEAPLGAGVVALLWYGRVLKAASSAQATAEEAARSSEMGFRTIAGTIADGIVTIDDQSRIQYASPSFERLLGYTSEELVGKEITMIMPERYRDRHLDGIHRYLSTGTRHLNWESTRLEARHKDGREVPVDVSLGEHAAGGRRVFTGVIRDVTERTHAEHALAESEAKFRGLITSAPDSIFVITAEGRVLDTNPAAETLLGRNRHEIVGHDFVDFVPTERQALKRKYLTDRIAGLRGSELYDGVFLSASGRRIHIQLASQVVRPTDEPPYLVYIARDVSDQRDMQRKLVESERWASMGRLASFVAHEINTPLTNISLLNSSIGRRVSDPEVQERVKKIAVQSKIAANITTELLRFARPGAITPTETNVTELVRAATEQAEAFRKPGTKLKLELGNRPVVCNLDANRIQEVIVNLVKNAYEATPQGSVTVRIEDRGDLVAIVVLDTGAGIPPDVLTRLFEAFFTTKPKGEGTGLGLAI